ncbi:MAG: nucleoside triphosphate pyrophosphohydrolase [Bacteroides sp.]|nr:nucleoside triphosphate pyrophosphohydrolase [Prevotella sp.]MCM1408092.1 nucleoside triphosphate pyrophosphohydrolase [Treponema brennaborense]MCM1469068.1 nucleoside triphosphate pyrophosphohydrolase [Bacteroides sp.]
MELTEKNDDDKIRVLQTENTAAAAFNRLYTIIRCLRAPDGCPWDKEQTPLSMRGDLIEETFEAVEAISQQDAQHSCEELGDVFLNTAMIAYMHEQSGAFSVADSLNGVSEKLIRRHPHVFPESAGKIAANEKKAQTPEEVLAQWDAIKSNVEGRAGKSILDEISAGVPPLLYAYKIQKKAARKGFDWTSAEPVYDKVTEELNEVRAAAEDSAGDDRSLLNIEAEIGDLLFSAVNLARMLGVNPETALSRSNEKFCRRFKYVEQRMSAEGIPMDQAHMEKMDFFWNEAKKTADA